MPLPKTPSFSLNNRRALVAGGSRGIGLGCAVALAGAGAEVVIIARNGDAVQEAVDQITAAGMSASGQALDVTDVDAVTVFF